MSSHQLTDIRLTQTKLCDDCDQHVMGIFWDHATWRAVENFDEPGHCLPCQLNSYLDDEEDHFKLRKRNTIKQWLVDGETKEINSMDLPKALGDFKKKRMLGYAWTMDDDRRHQLLFKKSHHRFDREFGARQRPWVRKELNKLGQIKRAPFVTEADPDLRNGEGRWEKVDETRKWAHGHYYN